MGPGDLCETASRELRLSSDVLRLGGCRGVAAPLAEYAGVM
jgi:hypothetical protein